MPTDRLCTIIGVPKTEAQGGDLWAHDEMISRIFRGRKLEAPLGETLAALASRLIDITGNGELNRQTLPFALTARIVLDKAQSRKGELQHGLVPKTVICDFSHLMPFTKFKQNFYFTQTKKRSALLVRKDRFDKIL